MELVYLSLHLVDVKGVNVGIHGLAPIKCPGLYVLVSNLHLPYSSR